MHIQIRLSGVPKVHAQRCLVDALLDNEELKAKVVSGVEEMERGDVETRVVVMDKEQAQLVGENLKILHSVLKSKGSHDMAALVIEIRNEIFVK